MWPLLFKLLFQRYNRLDMDEELNTTEHNITGVDFQICLMEYHTWGYPLFFLEDPVQGGLAGLPKWESREMTGV